MDLWASKKHTEAYDHGGIAVWIPGDDLTKLLILVLKLCCFLAAAADVCVCVCVCVCVTQNKACFTD